MVFPALSLLSPWKSHTFSLGVASEISRSPRLLRVVEKLFEYHDPRLGVQVWGRRLPTSLGLGAGIDKNGVAIPFWEALGFGFCEIGTVTPLAQEGRKEVSRLTQDKALINNLGFPNLGGRKVRQNLENTEKRSVMVGGNIGPNSISVQEGRAIEDYLTCFLCLYDEVDYIVANASSPNTPGLRDVELRRILETLKKQRDRMRVWKPLVVKVHPDIEAQSVQPLSEMLLGLGIDGVIVSNSTLRRPTTLRSRYRDRPGGLSGRPLMDPSTVLLSQFYRLTEGKIILIASGGVFPDTTLAKIRAGATLQQSCTGLIYEGPAVVMKTNKLLSQALTRPGVSSIQQLVGSDC